MSKGALGLLSAYWPEDTARYAHVPLARATQGCVFGPAISEGARIALAVGERHLTFAELAERTSAVAAALRERVERGARVALVLDDPLELLACLTGSIEADLLVWPSPREPDPAALAAFEPDLVVARAPLVGSRPTAHATPDALFAGGTSVSGPRPKLREPVLALAHPGAGEVLHSHKTLSATAIAFGSFFLLEPGAEIALFEPPDHWLGLAALLGALGKAATVHACWGEGARVPRERVDYAVLRSQTAETGWLQPGTRPWEGSIGIGAILGIESRHITARRRRLGRRLRAPVLTVYGRNDLGPVLGGHPSWYLDDAVGIPLPNVDARPLDPADGRELAIGWDAVEAAEMGVKSDLAPAGGERVGGWLRTRELAHVDPTGLYFLRG